MFKSKAKIILFCLYILLNRYNTLYLHSISFGKGAIPIVAGAITIVAGAIPIVAGAIPGVEGAIPRSGYL